MHGSCAYKYRVVGTVDTAGRKTLLLICCKRANARGRTERFIHLHREYPTPAGRSAPESSESAPTATTALKMPPTCLCLCGLKVW